MCVVASPFVFPGVFSENRPIRSLCELWLATYLHPFNDQDEYQEFKIRECRYGNIFKEFLNGKFDKDGLIKRVGKAEKKDLDDCAIVDEISMIDLESKKMKTVKHCIVD